MSFITTAKENTNKVADSPKRVNALKLCVLTLFSGLLLGFCAPGQSPVMNQWHLAWFGLVPLFLGVFTSKSAVSAGFRSFFFGVGYNAVWFHWLFFFHPRENCPLVLALFFFLTAVCHQGMLFAALGYISHKMRRLPIVFLSLSLPLVWVSIFNKIGNSNLFCGVPWSLIEYSQWCSKEFLQVASCIGGIGISALIVCFNLSLFFLICAFKSNVGFVGFKLPNKFTAVLNFATVSILVIICFAYGNWRISEQTSQSDRSFVNVSLIQGDISLRTHGAKPAEVVKRYLDLCTSAPKNSLCLWPEFSMPYPLRKTKADVAAIETLARLRSQAWIVGALDNDNKGRIYNSLYAIDFGGKMLDEVYHKQMPVPFGERMPFGIKLNDPRGEDYYPGSGTCVFPFSFAKIGSVICLESSKPEYTAQMVRDGAQILVNCSNTTWFSGDTICKQLNAFNMVRAVETGRYLAFVTTVGPSAVIDEKGRLKATSTFGKPDVVSYSIPVKNEITPFVRWFR